MSADDWDSVNRDERNSTSLIARRYELGSVLLLTDWCESQLAEQGITGVRTYAPRWNGDGEPIGPDMKISLRFEMLLASVAQAMATARREAFDAALEQWRSVEVPDEQGDG